uniref:Putative reverse transcriptase domain-containing protein n=1 Tax=Tanacetum cinerariifolium TaxID=118510 RepID=A0A699JTS1_TANCI|nr:putative reverse transcriptase domain-containing protein [Tanacetum cinerariifolium]
MVIDSPYHSMCEELASLEQTASGKDVSNLFMVVKVCQKPLGYFSSPMIHVPRAGPVIHPPGPDAAVLCPTVFGVPAGCSCWFPHSCWVMLKVSPWKGVVRFGKRGKLSPRYVGPFNVLAKVGAVAYRLELPQEFSRVQHTFQVSNLKKCYANEPLVMPLEGIHVDDRLQFVKEPVEIMEREIKRLK